MAVTVGASDPKVEEQLLAHIVELEGTLDAIRSGGVDAVLVGQPGAERIYTLTSAELPYKTIVDSMSEGALTVSARGIILFANRRFAQMTGADLSQIVGVPLATLIQKDPFGRLDGLLAVGPGDVTRADLELITSNGPEMVSVSATSLEMDGVFVRCLIATDLTSQREARVNLEHEVAARTADLERVNATMAETNRTLRIVSGGDQALIRATDEASLMGAICGTIVENGDYCLAWVGQAENDERQSVRRLGAAGETAYLDEIEVSWGPGPMGRGAAGRAIQTKTTQVVNDIHSSKQYGPWRRAATAHGLASVCSFPIHAGTKFIGALSIYAQKSDAFDAASVALLGGLAQDLSYGIEHLRDTDRLNASLAATIQAMAGASELRDPYTAGHQRRVADLASAIATLLGFGVWDVEGIKSAAAIHDIGKLVIPAEILSKPGRLTPQEFALVKGHAQAGHDIIAGIDFPWPVAEMVLQHHERQDGSGYPFGLMGADILAGSRVVSVADVVEAMSSHRPYREALGLEAALAEIERGRGNQYPRDVADACIFLCRRPELHFDPRGSQPFGNFP